MKLKEHFIFLESTRATCSCGKTTLLALCELLADLQGANRFAARGKIKLIHIAPPFATKTDFLMDKEMADQNKVLGAQITEFLRLASSSFANYSPRMVASTFISTRKCHYLKAVLDEVLGEENFVNQVIWKRTTTRGVGPIASLIAFHSCPAKLAAIL